MATFLGENDDEFTNDLDIIWRVRTVLFRQPAGALDLIE